MRLARLEQSLPASRLHQSTPGRDLFTVIAAVRARCSARCFSLTPSRFFNPHRSIFRSGNYDVNVIQEALRDRKCVALWFDKRKDVSSIRLNECIGLIVNVPSAPPVLGWLLPLSSRRHWYAIRQIGGQFYNLDSKLPRPEVIGDSGQLVQYLKKLLQSSDVQLFTVVSSDSSVTVTEEETPKKHTPNSTLS